MEHQYRGIITEKEEFLYPDSILETLQKELHIGMPLDGKPGIQLLLETASEEIVMQLEGEEFQAEWYQMREIPVKELHIGMPLDGKPGIQLLLETASEEIVMQLEGEEFQAEWYQMREIPVEYNTGDGENQGGAMVLEAIPEEKPEYATRKAPFWVYDCLERRENGHITVTNGKAAAMVLEAIPEEKPEYATRKAPFWVYDCLERRENGHITVTNGKAAVYLCMQTKEEMKPGNYTVYLVAQTIEGEYRCKITVRIYDVSIPEHTFEEMKPGNYTVYLVAQTIEGEYRCKITVRIYDVSIPEHTFFVTNWFSEESICRFHHVEKGTKEYLQILRKYVQAMRRMHQNVFFIQLDEQCVVNRDPYMFDFEYLTSMITCFFEQGMEYMELGECIKMYFLSSLMSSVL